MFAKILLSFSLLSVLFTYCDASSSTWQVIEQNFHNVMAKLSSVTSTTIGFIKKKYEQLEHDMNVFKTIHGQCPPCLKFQGNDKLCDCRNLEPKQDCLEFLKSGVRVNGIYKISAEKFTNQFAYCDQTTQGGGWTVFQRRKDGSENFYRRWADYKNGFGDLKGEFWFGNEKLHDISKISKCPKNSTLLINMLINSQRYYAKYNSFHVSNETSKYKLRLSGFSGNIGDKMSFHNGMKFSTYDQDNDQEYWNNVAALFKGGWWYSYSDYWGTVANLNGLYSYSGRNREEISWGEKHIQPTFVEMKIRRNS